MAFTDEDRTAARHATTKFESHMDDLCDRVERAEAENDSLRHTVGLQEAEIERQRGVIDKLTRARDGLLHDRDLMWGAFRSVQTTINDVGDQVQRRQPQQGRPTPPPTPSVRSAITTDSVARAVRAIHGGGS